MDGMRRNKAIGIGKSEQRSMLFVGVLVACIWAIRFLPQADVQTRPIQENRAEPKATKQNKGFKNWKARPRPTHPIPPIALRPFRFNPNTVSADSLQKMGLPKPLIEKWLKARERGFVFRKPENLDQFSILPKSVRAELLPFVVLPPSGLPARQKWHAPVRSKLLLELNQADTLELQGLPGIGPALAQRVVKYRERLGGFHQPQQLLEVYGIDSNVLGKVLTQILIDPKQIQMRSWNTISLEELKMFPYLSNKEAQIIVQYRKVHGPFASVESVKKIKGIRSDIPEKLTPYLHFEL
jgi:competence ComEA-like helix-hairpin-helix protein